MPPNRGLAEEAFEYFKRLSKGEEGMSFGWGEEVDDKTLGAEPEQMIVLGGESKAGKTTFAINTLATNVGAGVRCLYVTAELSAKWILYRLVCRELGFTMKQVWKPKRYMTREERRMFARGLMEYPSDDLYVFDPHYRTFSSIEDAVDRFAPDLVFIDHFQRLDPQNENLPRGFRDLAQQLKQLAVESECAIVVLSQVKLDAGGPKVQGWQDFDGTNFTYTLHKMRTGWTNELHAEADKVLYLHNLGRYYKEFKGLQNVIYHSLRDLPSEGYSTVKVDFATQRVGEPDG